MQDLDIIALNACLKLKDKGLKISTAESCTGGWVGKALTDVSGSSDWFECGFITYSNQSKMSLLNVDEKEIGLHGAVSEQVVKAMSIGALDNSIADVSISVSGIAGPGGGTVDKPVGTIWFGWCVRGCTPITELMLFSGDRETIRRQTVEHSLSRLIEILD